MVGVGERVIKTRTAAFIGCGVGGARDLVRGINPYYILQRVRSILVARKVSAYFSDS